MPWPGFDYYHFTLFTFSGGSVSVSPYPWVCPSEPEGQCPAQRHAGRMGWQSALLSGPAHTFISLRNALRDTPRSKVSPPGPDKLTHEINRPNGKGPNLGIQWTGFKFLLCHLLAVILLCFTDTFWWKTLSVIVFCILLGFNSHPEMLITWVLFRQGVLLL